MAVQQTPNQRRVLMLNNIPRTQKSHQHQHSHFHFLSFSYVSLCIHRLFQALRETQGKQENHKLSEMRMRVRMKYQDLCDMHLQAAKSGPALFTELFSNTQLFFFSAHVRCLLKELNLASKKGSRIYTQDQGCTFF